VTEFVVRTPSVTLFLTVSQTKTSRVVQGSGRHGGFRLSSGGALTFCFSLSIFQFVCKLKDFPVQSQFPLIALLLPAVNLNRFTADLPVLNFNYLSR